MQAELELQALVAANQYAVDVLRGKYVTASKGWRDALDKVDMSEFRLQSGMAHAYAVSLGLLGASLPDVDEVLEKLQQ